MAVTLIDDEADDERAAATVVDFDTFFVEHHDAIFRALALTLGDDELGRDAAAEGMARAFQRWSTVGIYRNPAGWVYRVGLNWARSRLRKWVREVRPRRQPEPVVHDPDILEPRLDDALGGLPVEQRAVVVLRYYLDWSESRIADALAIPPGTVKSRLSRALRRLASRLEDPDGTR